MPDDRRPEAGTPKFDPSVPYRPSLKDQVEALKASLESGEISEEEFNAAKRKLLGEWEGREFEERSD